MAAFLAAAIAVMLIPQTGVMDAMNGATPSLNEAQACLRERDFDCAEADLRAYLRKYHDDGRATANLAMAYTEDGRHKEALPYYKRALDLGVTTYDVYARYAVSLENAGRLDEAIKMNYASLKIAPSLVDVRGSLANELARRGRPAEALSLLEEFDRSLEDRGQSGYFGAQISQLQAKLGSAGVPVASSMAGGAAAASSTGVLNIPLQREGGAFFVPVVVDGAVTLKFVVDSGATAVTIPADVARTLMRMGKLGPTDVLGRGYAVLADGSRVPTEFVMIHSMKIGEREVTNVTAMISSERGQLLLGQSFLRRFKSWSVDNKRGVLLLQG